MIGSGPPACSRALCHSDDVTSSGGFASCLLTFLVYLFAYCSTQSSLFRSSMATPLLVGVGAIAAAVVGRQMLRRAGQGAAEQWVKGGFKAKMDRKEAIAILGLKCVPVFRSTAHSSLIVIWTETTRSCVTELRMHIGRLCLPTIPTVAVRPILLVKSTRRRIYLRRQRRGSRMKLPGASLCSLNKCLSLTRPPHPSVTSCSYAYCTILI